MKIQLLGNCTVLLSSKNSQIIFDPYFSNFGNLMYKRSGQVSTYYKEIEHLDAILLSHTHFDHIDMKFLNRFKDKCDTYAPRWSIKPLTLKTKSVSKGHEFTVGDFSITVVEAHHICPTVGYIVRCEGLIFYFAGDTYYGEFIKGISDRFKIDIAMLPVTQYFPPMTMGEKGTVKCLKALEPKYFIPMHLDLAQRFQLPGLGISISKLNDKMVSEKIPAKLVHLNNGENFEINNYE